MTGKLIIANWKMAVDRAAAVRLARAAVQAVQSVQETANAPEVILCPPYVYFEAVAQNLEAGVQLGAQDVAVPHHPKGAQTGDVSPMMLCDTGCTTVIIGHLERRLGHHEVNDTIRQKAESAWAAGLRVILCVGETAEERASGGSRLVVQEQVRAVVSGHRGIDPRPLIIAYEPAWAINGAGAATVADITEMHQFLRNYLGSTLASGAEVGLIYGGSVNADNAADILAVPHVDGVLVGSASLDSAAFSAIIRAGCAST